MTQDNDDLLAQVFSVLPTIEGQTTHNATDRKEEAEMVASVRRVSNAFHDFIEKSGVVETNVTLEHHESHHEVITHVESHHEIVIGGGVQIHHEEHDKSIGHGASIEIHHEHFDIGHGAAVVERHEESHGIGFGVSVMTTEMNPPETVHFELGHGAAPHQDDEESVVSVRSGLSKATSVSVHSSVSQKSAQVFNDAPVIVKAASHHSVASHKSSVVPESHHSEIAHTHDQESTISTGSTLTGSDASKNTAIEQYVISAENHHEQHEHHHHHHHHHHQHAVHHHMTASVNSTPIAPIRSEPLDALIEEFKLRHQKMPSEASSVVVAPVSVPPPPPPPAVPPPADSDSESDVVMTVKVTEYEFDSEDVKQTIEHPHKEHHHHHEEHIHHEEHVHHEEHLHHEDPIHHVEEHHHNGLDSHAIGHGVVPYHGSDEDFEFEHIEYEDVQHAPTVQHYEEHHEPNHAPAQPSNEIPPVFFNSPVLIRKTQQTAQNLYDTVSEASARLRHHHHHPEETDFHHHESIHHESASHHVHRELIPNLSGPHVREDLRPVHIVEEHHTTVVKTVPTPVAHVSPVVSQQEIRGLPRIDHREVLTPIVDIAPIVHKRTEVEQHHYHEDHHKHHHHDHQQHHVSREEKHYHKHDDQMSEILSGPSVRDLKSRFEVGGEIQIHFGTNYISHKRSSSAPIHVENHHEHHHQMEHHHHHEESVHHHHHEEPVHHHHKESVRHESVSISQPRLPHREVKESHQHHHHHDKKHHDHHHHHNHHHDHREENHHHSHNEKHQHHEEKQHHHHHHEEPVHHEHHHHEHHHVHEKLIHHHEEHHHHHAEQHFHTEEEEQLPVSALLSRYGGGAKLRRPDHFEKIEIYSRSSSVPNVADEAPHHVDTKSRTVTQSSVTTRGTRSQSTYSVQSTQRSHATTITHENNLSHAQNHAAPIAPISPAAPVAAARSTSADHQSLRVVKSVRAFVSEWGQKDFRPPMSPAITVPRLPSSPKEQEMIHTYPEAVSRKSTVVSHVSHHGSEHQQIDNVIQDDVSVCSQCSHPIKRQSVVSVVSNVNVNGKAHHETNGNIIHIGEGVQSHVPEVHEEFVLTPLSERRAIFEQGLNRGYSINRKTHGELRPMVNVFID